MRIRLLIFLLLVSSSISAQDITSKPGYASLDIYNGYRFYKNDFYGQLNTLKTFSFKNPVKTIGFGTSGIFTLSGWRDLYAHLNYHQFIPETIQLQDTVNGKLKGYLLSMALGGAETIRTKHFALFYYIGINIGRLKFSESRSLKQNNPFFSPKAGIQSKIVFGNIALIINLEYDYDLSRPGWRNTIFSNSKRIGISSFRQTSITGQVGLGFII